MGAIKPISSQAYVMYAVVAALLFTVTWQGLIMYHMSGPTAHVAEVSTADTRPRLSSDTIDEVLQLFRKSGVVLDLSHKQQLLIGAVKLRLYLQSDGFQRYRSHRARAQQGRGILIPASGQNMQLTAAVHIRVIRRSLKCNLPIELVYYGADDLDATAAAIIRGLNTTNAPIYLTDGMAAVSELTSTSNSEFRHRSVPLQKYPAKVFALTHVCRFREVFMLDSDNLPLVLPEALFDEKQYQSSHNMFWPDFFHGVMIRPPYYNMHGLPAPWQSDRSWRETESGQLLLDRLHFLDVLEWLWLLNSYSDVVYPLGWGDKDTYRLAFTLAGREKEFQQVIASPRAALHKYVDPVKTYYYQAMVQSLPDGRLATVHRTAHGKWFPNCYEDKDQSTCLIDWVTAPLATDRVARELVWNKFGMGLQKHQTVVQDRAQACTSQGKSHPQQLGPLQGQGQQHRKQALNGIRLPYKEDVACLQQREATSLPIPVVPIQLLGSTTKQLMNDAYTAYTQVAGMLKSCKEGRHGCCRWPAEDMKGVCCGCGSNQH